MIKYCNEYWYDVRNVLKCVPNIEKLSSKRILITGATGLICSAVVELLFSLNKNGANIKLFLAGRNKERVEKRFYQFTEGKDFFFVKYDATAVSELDVEVDYIIHGACNANPEAYRLQPVETMLSNLVGLNCLLSLAVKKKAKRVLYISSSEVYGRISEIRPYCEEDYGYVNILNIRASYPSSKRAAETMCISYNSEFDLDTVIVRPGHIYGPSITQTDMRATAEFTRNVVSGRNIVMKSVGTQLRSYCFSLDCASAILTVLIEGKTCNAYNISNKDSICTIRDIAETMANREGKKIIFQDATANERLGFNLMSNSSLNSRKIEQLGWRAIFTLEEGVAKTIEYYMKEKIG